METDGAENKQKADTQPTPKTAGGIYRTTDDAHKALLDSYQIWTGLLTQRSFELSMAMIAVNWATYGSLNQILSNIFAKVSLACVLVGLGILPGITFWVADMLRERIRESEKDPDEFAKDLERTRGTDDPWPFTSKIDSCAAAFRWIKVLAPVASGLVYLLGIFWAQG